MKARLNIDPVDAHVGQRLRFARIQRGLSQQKLASFENVTFQQMQKYESGANRISCSRLYRLAGHLRLSISWFFEGLENPLGNGDHSDSVGAAIPADKETYRLLRLFFSVDDPKRRKAILNALQSVIELMV
ncbi:MAG: helix-turn-helix transcriptional regulator [Alphaproteobacteria bacterium]|nr:helix-turn-helix transcriptional regulator [Alphaproteobacteria bacterium]